MSSFRQSASLRAVAAARNTSSPSRRARDARAGHPWVAAAVAAALWCGGVPAHAQNVNAAEAGDADPVEVLITGSRISRQDYEANSPITTVTQDLLQSTGAVTIEAGAQSVAAVRNRCESDQRRMGRYGHGDAEPARARRAPQSRAARRAQAPALRRPAGDRHQHDSRGPHPGHRGDQRGRVRRVRLRRHLGSRQHQAESALPGSAAALTVRSVRRG